MGYLIVSSIPLIILGLFKRHMSREVKWLFKFLCLPFFVIVAFYSLLIGLGILVALFIFLHIQKMAYKRHKRKVNQFLNFSDHP